MGHEQYEYMGWRRGTCAQSPAWMCWGGVSGGLWGETGQGARGTRGDTKSQGSCRKQETPGQGWWDSGQGLLMLGGGLPGKLPSPSPSHTAPQDVSLGELCQDR